MNASEFWDERFSTHGHTGWSDPLMYRYDQPHRLRAILRALEKSKIRPTAGSRCLDIGCGTGDLLLHLGETGATVVGIDVSPEVVAHTRRRLGAFPNVTVLTGDITGFQELEGAFDLITSVTVLQHVTDDSALHRACAALSGALAPGGHLVLLELSSRMRSAQGRHTKIRSLEEWQKLFSPQGVILVREHSVPQAAVVTLHLLHRLRGQDAQSTVVPNGPNHGSLIKRLILETCRPLDSLFPAMIPEKLRLYRLMEFSNVQEPTKPQ